MSNVENRDRDEELDISGNQAMDAQVRYPGNTPGASIQTGRGDCSICREDNAAGIARNALGRFESQRNSHSGKAVLIRRNDLEL